eukprot:gene9242-10217_t
MNQAFKPTDNTYQSGRDQRSGLLDDTFESSRDPYSSSRGTSSHADMNPSEIRATQQQIIKEQDKGLDALSHVIQRQKLMGQNIGEEVDYHNELIDEIGDHVDSAERRLIREDKHVRTVTKKAGNCAITVENCFRDKECTKMDQLDKCQISLVDEK